MNSRKIAITSASLALAFFSIFAIGNEKIKSTIDRLTEKNSAKLVREGSDIFRYDTFGDERFWGDTLKLHDAIKGSTLGGVGPGVSPKTALAVGLKVDVDALPATVKAGIKAGKVDLDDPKTTLALLNLNAVVGVKGFFDKSGNLKSLGVTCASCHSTVDNSFAPGIGHRLDGWPNRDLNVGAIVNLSPDLSAVNNLLGVTDEVTRKVLLSWTAGKYDASLFLDGKAFRPDGKSAATVIPAAFGLAGVNLHTYTGWGSVPYWNSFVAVLQMHGQGSFFDPRLDDAAKFPVAARNRMGHTKVSNDLVSGKLEALHYYQLSLSAPEPEKGSFNPQMAARGKTLFNGKANCISCHVPPTYSEPGWNMHAGDEIGIDNFQADRSPDGKYRTTPLKGLFARAKGGFYHDGRFPTYRAVVDHYDKTQKLGLTESEKSDLSEFLKSI
jgi:cytochrome c peroxidase